MNNDKRMTMFLDRFYPERAESRFKRFDDTTHANTHDEPATSQFDTAGLDGEPFSRERSGGRFAPFTGMNVYTFPVGDNQEGDEMTEDIDAPANAHKGGRYARIDLRATDDEKELLKTMMDKRGFTSLIDYIMSLVKKDSKRK